MWVSLTSISFNKKTGPIPVSTTEKSSCPPACPLSGTCYAKFGPIAIHWLNVSNHKRGGNWFDFCSRVKKIPKGQLWRHNQAGDLPGTKDKLNKTMNLELSFANKGRKGFTYTHYPVIKGKNVPSRLASWNLAIVQKMNEDGFTVNVSADTLKQADQYMDLGLPTVVNLPEDSPTIGVRTPSGRVVTVCPAQTTNDVNCAQCQLCQLGQRKSIVGFLAHGRAKRVLSLEIKKNQPDLYPV